MPKYVPYEQRARRRAEAQTRSETEASDTRDRSERRILELLAALGGSETDCYLEILRPVAGIRRRFTSKPVIRRGREMVVIDEIVAAYCIRDAISPHRIKTERPISMRVNLDAYVTARGRIWAKQSRAEGWFSPPQPSPDEIEGVIQVDDCSGHELHDLTYDELVRIAKGLEDRVQASPEKSGD